jgi:hypothetical protein
MPAVVLQLGTLPSIQLRICAALEFLRPMGIRGLHQVPWTLPWKMLPHGPSFSIVPCEVSPSGEIMPSLFRLLTLVGVLGGLTYGAMFMLATWFDPKPREITVSIPPDRFAKQP